MRWKKFDALSPNHTTLQKAAIVGRPVTLGWHYSASGPLPHETGSLGSTVQYSIIQDGIVINGDCRSWEGGKTCDKSGIYVVRCSLD